MTVYHRAACIPADAPQTQARTSFVSTAYSFLPESAHAAARPRSGRSGLVKSAMYMLLYDYYVSAEYSVNFDIGDNPEMISWKNLRSELPIVH